MTTVLSVGCNSNIACSVHHSVLAKVLGGALGGGWPLIASWQLHMYGKGSTVIVVWVL